MRMESLAVSISSSSSEVECIVTYPGKCSEIMKVAISDSLRPDTDDTIYRPNDVEPHVFHGRAGSFCSMLFYATIDRIHNAELTKTRIVAQRMNLTHLDCSPKSLESTRRKLTVERSLRHPNICKQLGFYHDVHPEGTPRHLWLFSERMDMTLEEFILKVGKYDGTPKERSRDHRWIAALMTQCLRALRYLHARGVTHGQLDPSKIGVNACRFEVKLLDTGGIDAGTVDCVTEVELPLFQAPEAIHKAHFTPKMDVWSVALCAIAVLGSRVPNPTSNDVAKYGKKQAVLQSIRRIWPAPNLLPKDFKLFHTQVNYARLDESVGPMTTQRLQQLFEKMLVLDAERRLSAEECLFMPYLMPMNQRYESLQPQYPQPNDPSEIEHVMNLIKATVPAMNQGSSSASSDVSSSFHRVSSISSLNSASTSHDFELIDYSLDSPL